MEDRPLKAALHINNSAHQKVHGEAVKAGLVRHGISAEFREFDSPAPCDFAIIWGWKQPLVIEKSPRLLVMERGHVGDRMAYTSCGWNGLGRRGRYPKAGDGGKRWDILWGDLMKPWTDRGPEGYALLIGQVPGDASLYGLAGGFHKWAQKTTYLLMAAGYSVVYRPHPLVRRAGLRFCPERADLSYAESILSDLRGASLCVTYNSTAGVDAVIAGVPTITMDVGAMAWPVASHSPEDPVIRPDRQKWAYDLAWTQWSIEEIRSGEMWAHVGPIMEAA